MIQYVLGDATEPVGLGNKLICHIVNDINKWRSGFVLAISARWKEPEIAYRNWKGKHLGSNQYIQVSPDIYVANMIAQFGVKDKDNPVPVRYNALRTCLRSAAQFSSQINTSIHMPRIGCDRGGGKWSEVEKIIQDELKGIDVTVYDLK